MKRIYLDNAATTRMDDDVITVMHDVMQNVYGNASSTHGYGKAAKSLLEMARKNIARQLHALDGEIIFTSGGTEANNMILRSAVRDLQADVVITSTIEHHAVLNTVNQLKKEYGITVDYVQLTKDGQVDLEHLTLLLKQYAGKKILVSLMFVNNELGTILPLKYVGDLCKEHGALFHSDTVQGIHHFPINVKEIPVDFMTASAHKFHGPKGVGFAYVKKDVGLHPLLFGGEQERGFRAGTEPVYSIVGMEKAFTNAIKNREADVRHLQEIKSYFIRMLTNAFPDIVFNGSSADMELGSPTILNVRFPFAEEKGKLLLFHLDLLGGIACSAGSACQSGSNKPSHVLEAILTLDELKRASLRFSFSKYTTKEEIEYTVKVLTDFGNK